MTEQKNNTKKYVLYSLLGMVALSIIMAWFMAQNLKQDSSKQRFILTKEYKKLKKLDYTYDEKRGQAVYKGLCAKCHRTDGVGTRQTPPLVDAKVLSGDPRKSMNIIIGGLAGGIIRNRKPFDSIMPGFKMIPSQDLAHVLNYVRKTFGKDTGADIPVVEIVKAKVKNIDRSKAYTEEEL